MRYFEPDEPQQLDYDPFTHFVQNEKALDHLRQLGVQPETIRYVRQGFDESLMELHHTYERLAQASGQAPPEMYGWGTETFYSATRPF